MMKRINYLTILLVGMLFPLSGTILTGQDASSGFINNPVEKTAPGYEFDSLVWSDEFDGEGAIDTEKWFHQTKIPSGGSWYNGEIQHYTDRVENAFLDSGYLHVMARKETYTDQGHTKDYTSARLNSKFAFTYGKVEVRAKLPYGVGTWPAIWMLGKNISEDGAYWYNQGFGTTPWPDCGEMDIMEHWGSNQDYVSSATHTPSSHGNTVNKGGQTIPDASTTFHNYQLQWSPEQLVFSVDGMVHFTYHPSEKNADTWPFDHDMYLLLNVAILPAITDTDFEESAMIIDYVRVYQESVTSVKEHSAVQQPECYPNPFREEITLDLGETSGEDVRVTIYNSQGSLIQQNGFSNADRIITIGDLDNLSPGLYIVTCEYNNKRHSFRVAKN